MIRLSDLKPTWRRIYRDHDLTADKGGFPTDDYQLTFVCPRCGSPRVVSIRIGAAADAGLHRWAARPMPDGPDWPARVTISPSIDNTTAGHGEGRACAFHSNIINGEVIP